MVDENGEMHTLPVPDLSEEEYLVKKGDRVDGFEVIEITSHFIELKSFTEYTTGSDSTPRTQFIIEMGEEINLNMYGVYDDVQRTSIKFIETVDSAEKEILY